MLEFLSQPWPWYVGGPLIGLAVPLLLLVGNKSLGISSSLRHVCASCFPAGIEFFKYDWRKETWNLYYVAGILLGGTVGGVLLATPGGVSINPQTITDLTALGLNDFNGFGPKEIFDWSELLTLRTLVFVVIGGFFVGFGTRYAGGCTSGHTIFGLSTLQWPSLVATISFMVGGFLCTHFLLPVLLAL